MIKSSKFRDAKEALSDLNRLGISFTEILLHSKVDMHYLLDLYTDCGFIPPFDEAEEVESLYGEFLGGKKGKSKRKKLNAVAKSYGVTAALENYLTQRLSENGGKASHERKTVDVPKDGSIIYGLTSNSSVPHDGIEQITTKSVDNQDDISTIQRHKINSVNVTSTPPNSSAPSNKFYGGVLQVQPGDSSVSRSDTTTVPTANPTTTTQVSLPLPVTIPIVAHEQQPLQTQPETQTLNESLSSYKSTVSNVSKAVRTPRLPVKFGSDRWSHKVVIDISDDEDGEPSITPQLKENIYSSTPRINPFLQNSLKGRKQSGTNSRNSSGTSTPNDELQVKLDQIREMKERLKRMQNNTVAPEPEQTVLHRPDVEMTEGLVDAGEKFADKEEDCLKNVESQMKAIEADLEHSNLHASIQENIGDKEENIVEGLGIHENNLTRDVTLSTNDVIESVQETLELVLKRQEAVTKQRASLNTQLNLLPISELQNDVLELKTAFDEKMNKLSQISAQAQLFQAQLDATEEEQSQVNKVIRELQKRLKRSSSLSSRSSPVIQQSPVSPSSLVGSSDKAQTEISIHNITGNKLSRNFLPNGHSEFSDRASIILPQNPIPSQPEEEETDTNFRASKRHKTNPLEDQVRAIGQLPNAEGILSEKIDDETPYQSKESQIADGMADDNVPDAHSNPDQLLSNDLSMSSVEPLPSPHGERPSSFSDTQSNHQLASHDGELSHVKVQPKDEDGPFNRVPDITSQHNDIELIVLSDSNEDEKEYRGEVNVPEDNNSQPNVLDDSIDTAIPVVQEDSVSNEDLTNVLPTNMQSTPKKRTVMGIELV